VFSELRSQAAADIQDDLGESASYTPVGTLDTRTIRVILHRARRSADPENRNRPSGQLGSEQFTRVTIFATDLVGGSAADLVTIESTGENFKLDTVLERSEVRTIWSVKTVVVR